MEVGGPYRVRQSMSSHGEHRLYDFADPSMPRLSSPALVITIAKSSFFYFQYLWSGDRVGGIQQDWWLACPRVLRTRSVARLGMAERDVHP